MGFPALAWRAIKNLFQIQTGVGRQGESLAPTAEAVASVFLPLAGLAVGFLSALAVVLAQALGLGELSALVAVVVISIFGGVRQINALMALSRRNEGFHGGVVLFAALSVVFLVYGFNLLGNARGIDMLYSAILFLPAAGALAMVSAACVMPEPEAHLPLSSVKGIHMLLAAALTLVTMLPRFGVASLAYVGVAVLAGSLAALILARKEYRADLLYVASAAAELAFLLLLLLSNKPIIYY